MMLNSDTLALMMPAEYVQVAAIPKLGSGKTDGVAARKLAQEALA